MSSITDINVKSFSSRSCKKRSSFRLHQNHELCIITLRPPPRWAKWSRGVRTRGLRVGLVGGPRPLLFLGQVFSALNPAFNSLNHQLRIDTTSCRVCLSAISEAIRFSGSVSLSL